MQIVKRQRGETLEVAVAGRLDAHWAEQLSLELSAVVRGGARRIVVDLAKVDFLSSAGIRVLLQQAKQAKAFGGTFRVANPAPPVKTVLALAGLEALLGLAPVAPTPRRVERSTAIFDVADLSSSASLSCRLLDGSEMGVSRAVSFPDGTFGVGVGAFGYNFHDCKGRFGEFVAAGGAIACRPTDGASVPDYQVPSEAFLPDIQVLQGLVCEGPFTHRVRFAAKPDRKVASLMEVVEVGFELTQAEAIGLVMIAEAGTLAGTFLARSPVLGGSHGVGAMPEETREPVSFPSGRAEASHLALLAGVVSRDGAQPLLGRWVRPLESSPGLKGLLYATAIFAGPLDPSKTEQIGRAHV